MPQTSDGGRPGQQPQARATPDQGLRDPSLASPPRPPAWRRRSVLIMSTAAVAAAAAAAVVLWPGSRPQEYGPWEAGGSVLEREGAVNRIGRRIRAAVNPVSTAATGWWCHSALRHMLTGHGPTARQRRLIRRERMHGAGHVPSAEQMKARAQAIDELLSQDGHQG